MLNIMIDRVNGKMSQASAMRAMFGDCNYDFISHCPESYIKESFNKMMKFVSVEALRKEVNAKMQEITKYDADLAGEASDAICGVTDIVVLVRTSYGIMVEVLKAAVDNADLRELVLSTIDDKEGEDGIYTAEAEANLEAMVAKLRQVETEPAKADTTAKAQSELVIEPVDGEGAGAAKKPTPATESKKKSQK